MALVYCKECGREVSDKAKFCPQCGFTFKIKGRGFAITSMVLGIIACTYSLPLFIRTLTLMTDTLIVFRKETVEASALLSGFMLIVAALSLIFGIVSASVGCKLKKRTAGITLGAVSCAVCIACIILNVITLSGMN